MSAPLERSNVTTLPAKDTCDFEGARRYALQRLEQELAPGLTYHCLEHTRDDVVPAVERLAALEGIDGEAEMLLLTAAYYHDLGMVSQRADHEAVGARICGQILPIHGYSEEQIQIVEGMIMATRLPQTPRTRLEEILADADLDVLGREDFAERNAHLYKELVSYGMRPDEESWLRSQLAFMRQHRYFTASARRLRDAGKRRNIAQLAARLDLLRASASIDRLAILRAVGIFSETPDEGLKEVASLLQPLDVPAGTTFIEKGTHGDSMYIIVSGRVRVHDGDRTLNHLGMNEVVGETAVLDAQPRSATVTAVEDTRLLRLDQAALQALLTRHPEVSIGIIHVLCGYLRARLKDMHEDYEYMQQMALLTGAAAALEAGVYDPHSVDKVAERLDALGKLARVFRKMAGEVQAREQRLKQEVQELRIQIDEAKKAREVSEITESEYFQQLQAKVKKLRRSQTT